MAGSVGTASTSVGLRVCRMVALVPALATVGYACAADAGADRTELDVRLSDFAIETPDESVAAGEYELMIHNVGPTVHELVIARTDLASDRLPMMRDGRAADEPSLETLAADEYIELDDTDALAVEFEPGHYVLYCNIEGHYAAGMHADLRVEAGHTP
jgi:uncharacterized cupredoxin-like copper-binding protein